MTTPGFSAEASLHRSSVLHGVAGDFEQPALAVYPAQALWESILSKGGVWNQIVPDCPAPMVPRYVQTGGYVCELKNIVVWDRVLKKFTTVVRDVCELKPFGPYQWECRLPTFTVAQ